ncbi:MAG: 2-oxoglutarate dehydrogenase component, partial [Pseudomonadota bacterium]
MGSELHEFDVDPAQEGPQAGPSWQNKRWPITDAAAGDDLTQAMDPMALKLAIQKSAKKGGVQIDEAALQQAALDSIRAMTLIRTYRVRGHLAANLDPLGLARQKLPADISPEYHGFTAADMTRKVYLGGALGLEWATLNELVAILRANYCGHIGFEYMHIADVEERRFIQDRIEGGDKSVDFTPAGKKAILAAVVRGEQYEKFLGKKYVGTKRFGLDGGESMIPALEALIKYGGQLGVREIVYGMAHRGRLNVLAN